jgi:hypothetical protein
MRAGRRWAEHREPKGDETELDGGLVALSLRVRPSHAHVGQESELRK